MGFSKTVLSDAILLSILSYELSYDDAGAIDVAFVAQVLEILPKLPPDEAPPPLSEETLSLSSSLHIIKRDSGNSRYSGISKKDIDDNEDSDLLKEVP